MSKIIKMTPESIEECKKEFEEAIKDTKLFNGKFSYSKTFAHIDRKAIIYFDPVAFNKMKTLIKEFDDEVAWHGVAVRGEDESKDEYYISDILVYPQTVTSVTVETDQQEYSMWLMSQEDEIFNNIRMQGHSHVNMGVTPSGVDETHQEKIIEQLEDDMFYIFMICNKSGKKYAKIYDYKKNILFENSDITVKVLDDGSGINEFLEHAKKIVKDKKFTYQKPNANNDNPCTSPKVHDLNKKSDETHKKRKGKRKIPVPPIINQ